MTSITPSRPPVSAFYNPLPAPLHTPAPAPAPPAPLLAPVPLAPKDALAEPTYNVSKLVERALHVPPDMKAQSLLADFIRGKDLRPIDVAGRAESLLYIADTLGTQQPRGYGIAHQSVVSEMRLRLVVRAIRAFVNMEDARCTVEHDVVMGMRAVMSHWGSIYSKKFSRNRALEFKIHEAKSLLASLNTTETWRDRLFRRVKNGVLLGASVASTLLPFLAVRINTPLGTTGVGDIGVGKAGSAGIAAVDLARGIVARKPTPAGWYDKYEALRCQLKEVKATRATDPFAAQKLETELAGEIDGLRPSRWYLFKSWLPEGHRERRLFLLGVLDLMERFTKYVITPETIDTCLPLLDEVLHNSWCGKLHTRAIETLLALRNRLSQLPNVPPPVATNLEKLYAEALTSSHFSRAQLHWQARSTARYQMDHL